MSSRAAWLCLALVALALAGTAFQTDLAALSGGRFWGDGATYWTAAQSLAADLDYRYEARDALRARREFADGAQGIFLKRASGGLTRDATGGFPWLRRVGEKEPGIYFAKPFTYSLTAAPFVRLWGTHGLLLTNALALVLFLLLAYDELRRQTAPGPALALSLALLFASITPVYLFWPTPEAWSVGLAAAALWSWRRGRWSLAVLLIGISAYSKPTTIFLAGPLCLEPLFDAARPIAKRIAWSAARGALTIAVALALFGVNAAITGEWNYQGGRERKTFYGVLPFEQYGVTFGNSGIWMSTNQVGASVEGKDTQPTSQGQEPPRSAAELRVSYLWNMLYFWIGRFGGALPYFAPAVLALVAYLVLGPRNGPGALALFSLAVAWLFMIWMMPDNWYGGSGTLGNRYFVPLLPLAVHWVPKGREKLLAALSFAVGLAFVLPVLAAPMRQSLDPGEHAKHGAFQLLPAELTMLNDLSIFGEPWRKKRSYGLTDPKPPAIADPAAYYLYFPDDGSYGQEEKDGALGFWLRGRPAEVFLRALEPVRRMTLRVTGGPAGDEVTVGVAGQSQTVRVAAGETRELSFEGLPRGFPYKDTFVHVVRLRSSQASASPGSADARAKGAFVTISLEVDVRPRPARSALTPREGRVTMSSPGSFEPLRRTGASSQGERAG